MNEIQATWGLLNLKQYKAEQEKRKRVKAFYNERLSQIKGIMIPQMPKNTSDSLLYYPIIIEDDYPLSRDELYDKFKAINIMTRKYFYPACHDFECYKNDNSIKKANLKVTDEIKMKVLCLPFYGDLSEEVLSIICERIENAFK